MSTGILKLIILFLVFWVVIPQGYFYCKGGYEGAKGKDFFFKVGFYSYLLFGAPIDFWRFVFFGK